MKLYKITHTREEIYAIYDLTPNREKQKKLMSVLAYYKKYSHEGKLKYTISRLYNMYKRTHDITQRYFYKLMKIIKDNFFTVQKIGQSENKAKGVDISNIGLSQQKHNECDYKIYNTNTISSNTIKIIKKFYAGITGRKYATKKDLIDIAKSIFATHSIRVTDVQTEVFAKIHNSKQRINLVGAVAYVNAIIMEKLSHYDSFNYKYI